MTTATPDADRRRSVVRPVKPSPARTRRDRNPVASWWGSLQAALHRPLTAYYLLLASSVLLLTIGLIMVLSASSVWSFKYLDGDSYAMAKRQLLWVVIGIPCAFVASRMSEGVLRRLAWPGYFVALAMLASTQLGLGTTRNGNTNWLGVGPIVIQPSEIAKLALIIWAAHIYARKERLLVDWKHCLVPVVPGVALAAGLVIWGRDLGTALVFFAILLGLLWVVGAPGRLFALGISAISVVALY